ncbi:MAG: DUF6624 domain-containing protein [Flavipsychrobacter sp.]
MFLISRILVSFRLFLFFFAFLICSSAYSQVTSEEKAILQSRKKSFLEYLDKNQNLKGTFPYSNIAQNLAIVYSILDQKDSTFYYLFYSFEDYKPETLGFDEVINPALLGEYTLQKWQNSKDWEELKNKIFDKYKYKARNVRYRNIEHELLLRKGADQSIRGYLWMIKSDSIARKKVSEIDKLNYLYVKSVIDSIGFPTISMVGASASNAAFLLCQHSDEDVFFQKKVLQSMLKNSDDIKSYYIAYLSDRILVKEKGYQLYGTQYNPKFKGKLYPIIDSQRVNIRRDSLGLPRIKMQRK